MLKGDGKENDLISKKKEKNKTNLLVPHIFFFELANKIYMCSTLFCSFFAVVLHNYNAILYD